jgi:hypothetical protein
MQQVNPQDQQTSQRGDNQTEHFNHTGHAGVGGGGESGDSASTHLEKPWCKYQQDCQQKAHAQLLTLP